MMHRNQLAIGIAIAIAIATALAAPVAVARADLKVVATTPDLAAIARDIGGEHIEVTSLSLNSQDPHFVDARPHLALELSRADLLLLIGLDLEVGWLPTLLTGSRNSAIQRGGAGYLDCSTLVNLMDVPNGRVDRSMGDIHPGGNPHYLFHPENGLRVARGIAARLVSLDGDNAAIYRERLQAFESRLGRARTRWEARLAGLRGAKIITYHRSFPYLAAWLGLEVVENIEPRPGIPPSPRHVAAVLGQARRLGVRLIMQETYYPDSASRLIADRSDATLVALPGGPDIRRGQTYIGFLEWLVARLAPHSHPGERPTGSN